MPKIGGKLVYDHIRKIRTEIRVVFASGYSPDATRLSFAPSKGIELLQKPYDSSGLLRKVRDVLDS